MLHTLIMKLFSTLSEYCYETPFFHRGKVIKVFCTAPYMSVFILYLHHMDSNICNLPR